MGCSVKQKEIKTLNENGSKNNSLLFLWIHFFLKFYVPERYLKTKFFKVALHKANEKSCPPLRVGRSAFNGLGSNVLLL